MVSMQDSLIGGKLSLNIPASQIEYRSDFAMLVAFTEHTAEGMMVHCQTSTVQAPDLPLLRATCLQLTCLDALS